jgi:hypothetical protein
MPMRSARSLWATLVPVAWRLPNGIKSASDDELEFSGDVCETWTWICGGAVVAAVFAEAAIAWSHPSYDSAWERWGSVVANMLVALGVAGEVVFAMMAFRRDKELKRRSDEKVAEANARSSESNRLAVEAQTALASFRAPRRDIFKGHEAATTAALKPFAGTKFDTGLSMSDGEQADFLWDLAPVITAAGWIHQTWIQFGNNVTRVQQGPSRPLSGAVAAVNVEIHVNPPARHLLSAAATALVTALNNAGIAAVDAGHNTHSENTDAIHVLIGTKR